MEPTAHNRHIVERVVERVIFGSRWILAPFYVGLSAALLLLLMKFAQTFWTFSRQILHTDSHEVILNILGLLDITLLANLILIVIFAGYENFVSKIEVAQDDIDRPDWMGSVDFSGLKLKLIGSLVAISVIELLKDFMNAATVVEPGLKWRIAIHITFVISGVLFAAMDYIAEIAHAYGNKKK
jgi:uncharacterized protein (TIGR00645 family)